MSFSATVKNKKEERTEGESSKRSRTRRKETPKKMVRDREETKGNTSPREINESDIIIRRLPKERK